MSLAVQQRICDWVWEWKCYSELKWV